MIRLPIGSKVKIYLSDAKGATTYTFGLVTGHTPTGLPTVQYRDYSALPLSEIDYMRPLNEVVQVGRFREHGRAVNRPDLAAPIVSQVTTRKALARSPEAKREYNRRYNQDTKLHHGLPFGGKEVLTANGRRHRGTKRNNPTAEALKARPCQVCGTPVGTSNPKALYCSAACRQKAVVRRKSAAHPNPAQP